MSPDRLPAARSVGIACVASLLVGAGCRAQPSTNAVADEVEVEVESVAPEPPSLPPPVHACVTRSIDDPAPPWVKISDDPPSYTRAYPEPSCDQQPSYQRRSTLDLPEAERTRLRELLLAESGLIVVARSGCGLTVLTDCRANHDYEYWPPINKGSAVQRLERPEELWANFPVRSQQQLDGVELRFYDGGSFVQTFELGDEELFVPRYIRTTELELEGRCEDATHVVVEVVVGAAQLRARDGRVLVEAGVPGACRSQTLQSRARRGCLEPIAIALVPLDPHARHQDSCAWRTRWTGIACVGELDLCLSPEPRECRGEQIELGLIRPLRLAPERMPCEEPGSDEILQITVDGPRGRITEVCGNSHALAARAENLFEWQLEVSREQQQRFELTCPPTPLIDTR